MKTRIFAVLVSQLVGFFCFLPAVAQVQEQKARGEIPYGNNAAVGKYAELNGIRMYYEIYGNGDPLVLIHGNSGSIASMKNQIPFFARDYRVIVADSREQGKSTSDGQRITFDQMALDWALLMDHLNVDSAYVLGWSDGGIIGLLLAIHHPAKVKKLAIMGANLEPDSTAVYSWAIRFGSKWQKIAEDSSLLSKSAQVWQHVSRMLDLVMTEPHIPFEHLNQIQAPTLVMSADKDIIREEHTLKIFQNIPKAHLCIFPGATHSIPREDPNLFNQTVLKFFQQQFRRPDSKYLFQ